MPSEETKIAVLEVQLHNLNQKADHLQDGLDIINSKLDNRYATKDELAALRSDHQFWRNILVSVVSASLAISVATVIALITK